MDLGLGTTATIVRLLGVIACSGGAGFWGGEKDQGSEIRWIERDSMGGGGEGGRLVGAISDRKGRGLR